MYQPTLFTWILIAFGLITCLPLFIAQLTILLDPKGKKAKDVLIGKDQEWRDPSHFKTAYGAAVADWLVEFPIMISGMIGILLAKSWGYVLFAIAGAIQVYINIILWYSEKEYVYPSQGPLRYYTYYWGNFIYWGIASFVYGIYRIL